MANRSKPNSDGPFFADYLAGEQPLSGPTARTLYDLSRQLYRQSPWKLIHGDDPFVLDLEADAAPVYITVLGSAGEIFGLKAYQNLAAQAFLLDLLAGREHAVEHFLLRRQVLSLEYSYRRDLDVPDRDLLNAMEHTQSTAPNNPFFRAGRPGSHDWYITEQEGQRFCEILAALVWLFTAHSTDALDEIFSQAGWPRLTLRNDRYEIAPGPVPERPTIQPDPVTLPSPEALALLTPFAGKLSGIVEMEAVVTPAVVGGKLDRPDFVVFVLAVEADTGFALAPEAAKAASPIAPALTRVIAAAAEARGGLPAEIHHAGSLHVIKPLLDALGVKLELRRELPAFEHAMGALMEHISPAS